MANKWDEDSYSKNLAERGTGYGSTRTAPNPDEIKRETEEWKEVLAYNLAGSSTTLPWKFVLDNFAAKLGGEKKTIMSVILADAPEQHRHARDLARENNFYGNDEQNFITALEKTGKQYAIASVLAKNLMEQAHRDGCTEYSMHRVAFKFMMYVEKNSGKQAETFFDSKSTAFSDDMKDVYARDFMDAHGIVELSPYGFKAAVKNTDIAGMAAEKPAAGEDAALGIFAKKISAKFLVPEQTGKAWAKEFMEYAKKHGGVGSFEALNRISAESARKLVIGCLNGMGYNGGSMCDNFAGAIREALIEAASKKEPPAQKSAALEAFSKEMQRRLPGQLWDSLVKHFTEHAVGKNDFGTFEEFLAQPKEVREGYVDSFMRPVGFAKYKCSPEYVWLQLNAAIDDIAKKGANVQGVQTGTAREIFARHLAATTGRGLESAAKIAAEYESYVLKSTNFPAFGDFCMQSGRSEGLAIHFISKYSIKCGISFSELGEFTEAVSLAAKELAAQAQPTVQKEEVAVQSDGSQMGSFRAKIRGIVPGGNAEKLVAKLEEAMKNGGATPDKTLMKHQKLSNFDREMLNAKPPVQNLSELMEFDVWACAKAVVGPDQGILDGVLEAFRQVKKAATEIPPTEFTPKRWMEAFMVMLPQRITQLYGTDELTKHLSEALSEAGLKVSDLLGLDAPAMEKLADFMVEKNYRGLPHTGWNLRGDVCRAIQQANISEESRMAQAKEKAESTVKEPAAATTAKLSEEYVGKLNDSFTKRKIIEERNARSSQPHGQHFQKNRHHKRW